MTNPMSGDTLTTEQARGYAARWVAWHNDRQTLRGLSAIAKLNTPAPKLISLNRPEREQLFAWVRARILAEGNPDAWQDPAEHMVNIVASDLGITDAQAEALIDAADGWPP